MNANELKYECVPTYTQRMWENRQERNEQTEAQRNYTAATVEGAEDGMILLAGGGRKRKYRR